jgi:phosphohistidine swiveling domain-containing protein
MTTTTISYERPGPGTWMLDRAHCQRARVTYLRDTDAVYTAGFREGFRRYGGLLDTLELAYVNGVPYLCPRPVGAPPEPKGTPPKFLFKLLLWLHPELRRRTRRAQEVFQTRAWRQDLEDFTERFYPETRRRLLELQAVDLEGLDDTELLAHLERVRELAMTSFRHHFSMVPAYMVAVGDFLAHAAEWTRATRSEVLGTLEGASPVSREGADFVDAVADALQGAPSLRALALSDTDPAKIVEALRADPGPVGEATRRWIETVGARIFTGFDLDELTALEAPAALVRCLRCVIDGGVRKHDPAEVERRVRALRERVPAEHRARFDEIHEEARVVYGLRDAHSSGCEMWTLGVLRLALLGVGRRLAARGLLHEAAHALDLTHAELTALFEGKAGPPADEIAARAHRRAAIDVAAAPDRLGPPPAAPPPASWLPPGAARLQRAFDAYLSGLLEEREPSPEPASAESAATIRGLGASPGKHVGIARLILGRDDFDRLRPGDVLVAPITTPAYNIVLPLLGGVVTDRGGLLSHPAIVTREYRIPGVVGTRDATLRIPDGARVEIDGDAGTVVVLS